MTNLTDIFRKPQSRTYIQYEALSAHFVDNLEASKAAECYGHNLGSFRNLCTKLRADPNLSSFFVESVGLVRRRTPTSRSNSGGIGGYWSFEGPPASRSARSAGGSERKGCPPKPRPCSAS